MGQGAKKLEEAVGSKRALVEFAVRAETLRQASTAWKAKGFSIGPFQTTRDNASKHGSSSAAKADPWATSVAFGKRYQISALPEDDVLRNDLNQMLGIYNDLVKKKTLSVVTLDEMLQHMAATGEMPDAEAGIDGAKRVILPRHSRTQPDAQLASVSRA
jgi:hypothetical protein